MVAYIGLASNTFKERYLNHISSFRNQRYKESTALSKYIWKLKDQNKPYEIKWFIDMYASSYHCNTEKTLILTSTHHHLLNQRSELISTCRHRRKYLISSI